MFHFPVWKTYPVHKHKLMMQPVQDYLKHLRRTKLANSAVHHPSFLGVPMKLSPLCSIIDNLGLFIYLVNDIIEFLKGFSIGKLFNHAESNFTYHL